MLTASSFVPAAGTTSTRRTSAPSAASHTHYARPLAAMLLSAIVAALLVAADALIDIYADGHLLLAWTALWAVGFAAMALFAGSARTAARQMLTATETWRARREDRHADTAWWALAQRDPRIMADLQSAMERSREEQRRIQLVHGRAWVDHHPLGTLNAGYAGPRRMFRASPLTGLPMHLQCDAG